MALHPGGILIFLLLSNMAVGFVMESSFAKFVPFSLFIFIINFAFSNHFVYLSSFYFSGHGAQLAVAPTGTDNV